MNKIKLKGSKVEYDINNWDYFYNGSCLMIVVHNGPKKGHLLETVPKKYYNDILFSNHSVLDCGVRETIPKTVSTDLKNKPYKYIKMKR